MPTPHEILKQYWKFDQFREKQSDIIDAILGGQDTLALLPTGGGKSICYQVPGLVMEGVCLVISPLIALMEDQINQLKSRGISAVAIHSGMSARQIDIALDNSIYGTTKFLYVSPERLKTSLFQTRFTKMKINLVAIDEAHCISEWGYDFRPSYLTIAELRKLQPTVPFLALTATATTSVVEDIQEQLLFRSKNVIQKSFERSNLTYNVALTNNKLNRIEASLRKNEGSGIIYCGTRRKVKELYHHINAKQIAVDYYHAGLTYEDRKRKQARWTTNEVDLIVATNAFGMGIDKPDVRYVLHHDIPASLEAYFQEAGRAGRDGQPAVANLFYETDDINRLKEQVELKYPPLETIKRIYNALGNHLQLAYGSGKGETYPIDLALFADKYSQPLMLVYNALKFLERCEFIELSENYKVPSQIKMTTTHQELYNYQVKDPVLNTVIQFILRTEMGVFENYQTIYETKISAKINLPVQTIVDKLTLLNSLKLIDYIPRSELPLITYVTERLTDQNLSISPRYYQNRKDVAYKKLEAMIHFLTAEKCKSQLLLEYFGETDTQPCGHCSYCIRSTDEIKSIRKAILSKSREIQNKQEKVEIAQLIAALSDYTEREILENLRWLAEHHDIIVDQLNKSFVLN